MNLSQESESARTIERLEKTLGKFVAQVAKNEEVSRKIDDTEEAIYKTRTLEELLRVFIQQIKKNFDIPVVKISLVEESSATKTIVDMVPFEVLADYYSLIRGEELKALPGIDRVPILSNSKLESFDGLFSDKEISEIKSLALAPIFSENILVGVIGFGSYKEDHYNPEDDTSLLEKLGRRFSICLDNVLKSERLKELSITDDMTGLFNKRGTHKILTRKIEENRRFKQSLTLIYFDLDKFKPINDQYGHQVGDKAIQHFAYYLKAVARGIDALCRMGGDEFMAILPGTNRKEAETYLERFKTNLAENLFCCSSEKSIKMEFSFGMITIGEGERVEDIGPGKEVRDINELIDVVDKEMLRHKKGER